jgi:hypothetical protein
MFPVDHQAPFNSSTLSDNWYSFIFEIGFQATEPSKVATLPPTAPMLAELRPAASGFVASPGW